jgi:hypothetical protein
MTDEAWQECPYCKETIKASATRCRYCTSDLVADPNPPVRTLAARGGLSITIGGLGGLFGFGSTCDSEYDDDVDKCYREFNDRHKNERPEDRPLFDDELTRCKSAARTKRRICREGENVPV